MDTMNNYGTMNQGMMGAQMGQPGVWGNPFPGNPMTFNPAVPQPTMIGSLSEEEIKTIATKKPNKIDINIDPADHIRSMCNHKHNGMDVVKELNDGSGRVYCPICGAIWTPTQVSKEEIQDAVDLIYNQMQNAKWVGDYNIDLVRDYFPVGELLKKFPDLHEFAMKQFNRYLNAGNYNNANDAAVFQQFNQIMYGTPSPMMGGYYQQPQAPMMGQPMQQAPMMGQQAPVYNPMQGYQQGMPASPMVNPMQAPMGQMPMGQFGNQADMMMQGGYYQQPAAPQYAPVNGVAPVAQPAPTATNAPTTQDAAGDAQTNATVTLS